MVSQGSRFALRFVTACNGSVIIGRECRLCSMQENNLQEREGKAEKTPSKAFFQKLRDESWTYIRTVVDVVRQPILILDKDLRILAANEAFLKFFKVKEKDTEGVIVYELGNGQWNIPTLKRHLETVLPKKTYFRGFTVAHLFPKIGQKTMILNARQIFFSENASVGNLPEIILLAMEDITEIIAVADSISNHTSQSAKSVSSRLSTAEAMLLELQQEVGTTVRKRKEAGGSIQK